MRVGRADLPDAGVVLEGEADGLLVREALGGHKQHLQQDARLGAEPLKALSRDEDRLL